MEDVKAEDVDKLIDYYKGERALDENESKIRQEKVQSCYFQDEVNCAYGREKSEWPYVIVKNTNDKKEIDEWILPGAVKLFKEHSGFRVLKVVRFPFFFWRKYTQHLLVLTHLKENKKLISSIKSTRPFTGITFVAKEY